MPQLTVKKNGFTLVELMVVIVVMALLASLVMMNSGGVTQRKAMQARELLLLDLVHIRRVAEDQSQTLALVSNTNAAGELQYQVVKYQTQASSEQIFEHGPWQIDQSFKARTLPPDVRFETTALEPQYSNATNQNLIGAQAPHLIWLGNGEVKPVRIQFFVAQQPLGAEIYLDYLGKVSES